MNVINAVAEFERDQMVERTQAGWPAPRSRKKPRLTVRLAPESRAETQRRLADGASVSAFARAHKIGRQWISRASGR